MPPSPKRSAAREYNEAVHAGAKPVVKRAEEAIPTSIFDTERHDRELQAHYGMPDHDYKPAFLYVERGPGQGQLLEVKQGAVVIGRASVSDLRVQHPSISRRHAQVKRVGEQFFIKDLGSQNGTFVNKQRIGTEVELKIGDLITLGNAQLKLRGPMSKSERSQPAAAPAPAPVSAKARQSTAVVARPGQPGYSAPARSGSSRALKIAVFAGAMGFGLATVLAFALVKTLMVQQPAESTKAKPAAEPEQSVSAREKEIQEAIARRMAEREREERLAKEAKAAEEAKALEEAKAADEAKAAEEAKSAEDVKVEETKVAAADPVADKATVKVASPPVVVKNERPPAVTVAKTPTVARLASNVAKRPAAAAAAEEDEEAEEPAGKGGNRQQILAAYERGNAEGSLEAAKKAGNKELADKLSRFIAHYDAAKDAVLANNGSAAITNFSKAKDLDDQLSNGWSKYGGEIRKQLGHIYVLAGMQYASTGNAANAKKAFEAAIKYDPNNQRAKDQLAKLSGGGGDDEEEDAPAPKPAPKKAPPKNAIDDAFGD